MELLVFSLFAAALLVCVIFHISLLFALLLGYVIFALYAIRKGFSLPEVLGMSAQGVRAAKNILTTFVLIGILTSLWRAGGTIPAIVCYSVRVMEPRLFLVCSFLLNCLVSFLTGTAFGSAATMGAVCMTMAAALGADPLMTGGAILSGVYFGDRCSPVSTSALLVADLTGTDLFGNIRQMLRTSLVPCALAAGLSLLFGLSSPAAGQAADGALALDVGGGGAVLVEGRLAVDEIHGEKVDGGEGALLVAADVQRGVDSAKGGSSLDTGAEEPLRQAQRQLAFLPGLPAAAHAV